MGSPAISPIFAPAPMPPAPPYGAPDIGAPLTSGGSDDLTAKQQSDLAMRKQYGTLWRDSREQSNQMKAEQRERDKEHTAAYFEKKDNTAEPRMSGREHSVSDSEAVFDLDQHWGTGPRDADDVPVHHAKRSAAGAQDDSAWQHLYTRAYNDLFSDQANLQSFYNEINGYSCSGNSCTSGTDVHLDWTGSRPHEAREPFTYPVLIDNSLRILKAEAFNAVGNRLHAVSYPAPYPFMNSQPPRNREAVPVMASSGECAHITPYQPASCASFSAGDQVAQIDKFFRENIAQGKVPGAVFVDAAVIDEWGKESSMKGVTALAVRGDPDHKALIFGLVGGGVAFISVVFCTIFSDTLKKCPRAVSSRVQSGWESCKTAASAWWNRHPRLPLAPPAIAGVQSHQDAAGIQAEESSVVVDDSDTDSGYLGDFSSSSSSSSSNSATAASRNDKTD